jgi:hypothetical protein
MTVSFQVIDEWAVIDRWWTDEPYRCEYKEVLVYDRPFVFRQSSLDTVWRICNPRQERREPMGEVQERPEGGSTVPPEEPQPPEQPTPTEPQPEPEPDDDDGNGEEGA